MKRKAEEQLELQERRKEFRIQHKERKAKERAEIINMELSQRYCG
jgi:hypothetical protein